MHYTLITFLLLALLLLITTTTSRSNEGFSPYNYDKNAPLFTPDGRLLQVEYATTAVTRTPHPSTTNTNGGSGALVCAVKVLHDRRNSKSSKSTSKRKSRNSKYGDSGSDSDVMIVVAVRSSGLEGSDILDSTSSQSIRTRTRTRIKRRRLFPLARSTLTAPLGLLPDAVSLVQTVGLPAASGVYKDYDSNVHISHGGKTALKTTTTLKTTPPTSLTSHPTLRIATAIANACGVRTLGGGVRVYGAGVLVCSVECDSVSHNQNDVDDRDSYKLARSKAYAKAKMYLTTPSGNLIELAREGGGFVIGGRAGSGKVIESFDHDSIKTKNKDEDKDEIKHKNKKEEEKAEDEEQGVNGVRKAVQKSILSVLTDDEDGTNLECAVITESGILYLEESDVVGIVRRLRERIRIEREGRC